MSDLDNDKFSIAKFYERRARRILPALFFVTALCIPFAWAWLSPADMKDFMQSVVAVATFSSNILFWLESGYFDSAAELKPLLHTWSLAVEEQYYILFPLFLMLIWRLGVRKMVIILAILFAGSLALSHWGAYNQPTATFYLLPTRGWELLIGAFAAFALRRDEEISLPRLPLEALGLLGLALIGYAIFAFDDDTPFPSLYALAPTLGTLLIILFATPGTVVNRLLGIRMFVLIGLISYSAYLLHQPMLAFAKYRSLGEPSLWLMGALCLATFPLAYLSWSYVEEPFRSKKFSRRAIFTGSIMGLAAFGSLGLWYRLTVEEPTSVTVEGHRIDFPSNFQGLKQGDRDCTFPALGTAGPCSFAGKADGNRTLVLIGDSHARVLSEALAERRDLYSRFVDLTASGCPFSARPAHLCRGRRAQMHSGLSAKATDLS